MKKLIIILGMHRSGTSLTAHISQCMGAYLGEDDELMGASLGNPDGHFENLKIARIDNNILQICKREWYSLEEPDLDYNQLQIKKVMKEIKAVIQGLFEKSNIVAVKDPRIAVLLPLWEKLLKELEVEVRYIWVFRNPLEVMESLKKRNGYSSQHGLLLWIHYNLEILKFLKEKDYLTVNYKDILEHSQTVERIAGLIGCELNDDLRWELSHMIKKGYSHSDYSYQDVLDTQNRLLSDLYGALLDNQEREANVPEWEKRFKALVDKTDNKLIDYQMLENIQYLEGKEIVIYGAGQYGIQAAGTLHRMGHLEYSFCDRDINKHGMIIRNGKVLSITEVEEKDNLLFIIAVKNGKAKKEIVQTLACIKNAGILSLFVLEAICWYWIKDSVTLVSETKIFSKWYKQLEDCANNVRNACTSPILVYQNGKVASLTVSQSLWRAGIENAHVHRFFFKKDIVGELILGDEQKEFIKRSNVFSFQSPEYVKAVKEAMRYKKIITMVREPIAVDLSTVFQWIGDGITDCFFAYQKKQGKTFLQSVSELMVNIQNRMFDWFDEELKELSGIDVYEHPFDREKGYTVISKNGTEVLLLKAEKLSNLTAVIRDFVGNQQFELINENVGENKEYAYLYQEVKKKIQLSKKYVDCYYKNNPRMGHFYSEEEQRAFLSKWGKHIKEVEV